MNLSIDHHRLTDEKYHIFIIGNGRFCIGCLASNVFLYLILPILMNVFFKLPAGINIMIYLIIIPQVTSDLLKGFNGTNRKIPYIREVYIVLLHAIMLVFPITITIADNVLLAGILLLIIPQFAVYGYKIISFKEFKFPRLKFLIRLLFINAYFLAIIYLKYEILGGLILIGVTALSFHQLRSLSSKIITSDGDTNIQFTFRRLQQSIYHDLLNQYNILNRNTRSMFSSKRGSISDVIKAIFIIIGVLALIMVGLVIVMVSNSNNNNIDCAPNCNTCGSSSGSNSGCCDCNCDCNC